MYLPWVLVGFNIIIQGALVYINIYKKHEHHYINLLIQGIEGANWYSCWSFLLLFNV